MKSVPMWKNNLRFETPLVVALAAALSLGAAAVRAGEPDVRRDATVAAVERVLPCVVNIATETVISIRDPFEQLLQDYFREFRAPAQNSQVSLGSGVIIDENGYVLTNDHVVRRATRIWVKVSTNATPYEAKLIAGNAHSDVALIKLQARPDERFPAVHFAQDDDVLLGETVLAMGNPFGLGESVSRGILSSKSRVAPKGAEQLDWPNWLQTDASINPGNSGGPLVNLRGELIGLNVAMLQKAQGIGFAIPVKLVSEALSGIFTPESAGKGLWFGAQVRIGTSPLSIAMVQPRSPADKAGLRAGDVVLKLNGQTPHSFIDFTESIIRDAKSPARLVIERHGERRELTIKPVPEASVFNADMIEERTGLRLEPITAELARSIGLNATDGFVVAEVDREGPAAGAFRPGYLITAIDGQAPADLTAAAKLLYPRKAGEKVRLDFVALQRRGAFRTYQERFVELPLR